MKKIIYLSLALLSSAPLLGMRVFDTMTAERAEQIIRVNGELENRIDRCAHEVACSIERTMQEHAQERQRQAAEERRRLEDNLRHTANDMERQHWMNQLAELERVNNARADRWGKVAADMSKIPGGVFCAFDGIKAQLGTEQSVQQNIVCSNDNLKTANREADSLKHQAALKYIATAVPEQIKSDLLRHKLPQDLQEYLVSFFFKKHAVHLLRAIEQKRLSSGDLILNKYSLEELANTVLEIDAQQQNALGYTHEHSASLVNPRNVNLTIAALSALALALYTAHYAL